MSLFFLFSCFVLIFANLLFVPQSSADNAEPKKDLSQIVNKEKLKIAVEKVSEHGYAGKMYFELAYNPSATDLQIKSGDKLSFGFKKRKTHSEILFA